MQLRQIVSITAILISLSGKAMVHDTIVDSSFDAKKIHTKIWLHYANEFPNLDMSSLTQITENLRVINVYYYGYDRLIHKGQVLCNEKVANEIVSIFKQLLWIKFPIKSVIPVSEFNYSDELSMQVNNSSCFDFRLKTLQNGLSNHAYGTAIDLNPLVNPYVTSHRTIPLGYNYSGNKGLIRDDNDLGLQVIQVFRMHGWSWGGYWKKNKDYMHFEKIRYF
jgi:hypothetical protein